LPDTYNVGLSANYSFDQRCGVAVPRNFKDGNFKDQVTMQPITDNLLAWTTAPAVYMPQVLAIVDPNVSLCSDGTAPSLISSIPSDTGTLVDTVDESIHFSSSNLVFSIVSITPTLLPGDIITLTSNRVLHFDTSGNQYSVVIQAKNACGVAVSNAFLVAFST
jgi:hypothetical protein